MFHSCLQVQSFSVGGVSRAFAFGSDANGATWIEAYDLVIPNQATGSSVDVQIVLYSTAPAVPSICSFNALGTAECEYVFYGKSCTRLPKIVGHYLEWLITSKKACRDHTNEQPPTCT
jgi:hypothetical protein